MELTDIINCIIGGLALLVSIIAIIISIHTTRTQIKLDLFNRRYRLYVICEAICSACLTNMPDIVEERLKNAGIEFDYFEIESSKYLFDKETANTISDIIMYWLSFQDMCFCIKEFEEGKNINKEMYEDCKKEKERLVSLFKTDREQLDNLFKKYLKI